MKTIHIVISDVGRGDDAEIAIEQKGQPLKCLPYVHSDAHAVTGRLSPRFWRRNGYGDTLLLITDHDTQQKYVTRVP